MNTKYKWTVLDIEPLLKEKSFEELNAIERAFLVDQLGNETQIKEYQKLLQCCETAAAIQPNLCPKAGIQAHVRSKVPPAPSVVKNGLESIFVVFSSLFAVRSPIRSGMAIAMLTLAFWFGGNMEQSYYNNFEAMQDSLAINSTLPDAAVYQQTLQNDSNTMITLPKALNHKIMADSFTVKGILRQ